MNRPQLRKLLYHNWRTRISVRVTSMLHSRYGDYDQPMPTKEEIRTLKHFAKLDEIQDIVKETKEFI